MTQNQISPQNSVLDTKTPPSVPKKLSINYLEGIAKNRGWKCKSEIYYDYNCYYIWECENSHLFKALLFQIKKESYKCPTCNKTKREQERKEQRRVEMELMVAEALRRKLHYLSGEYKNQQSKLLFKCGRCGRKVYKKWQSLKVTRACCYCRESRLQKRCREIFEEIYEKPFLISRPEWLRNDSTVYYRVLELDGYNEGLGVAFEHNGIEHDKPVYPGETQLDLLKRRKRDKYKIKMCKEKGIELYVIPSQVRYDDLREYILAQILSRTLEKQGAL